jgi:hypothetical protein
MSRAGLITQCMATSVKSAKQECEETKPQRRRHGSCIGFVKKGGGDVVVEGGRRQFAWHLRRAAVFIDCSSRFLPPPPHPFFSSFVTALFLY